MPSQQISSELSAPSEPAPKFLPLSLMRLRKFLFESGMPIVPWASAQEVLDELHELLHGQQANDAFWQALYDLLQGVKADLNDLLPSDAKGNAALTLATRQVLLDELRKTLDPRPPPGSNFGALARKLSQGCLVILLLLGGAATVSCGGRSEDESPLMASSGGFGNATGGASNTGGQSHTGGAGFVLNTAAQGGSSPGVNSGTTPCNSSGLSPTAVQSIAVQCIQAGSTRDAVLACLSTLNSAWQQGVETLLNCQNCQQAAYMLTNLMNSCANLPTDYESCIIDPCLVYMGVRMD